jgi:serine/threonine protein kinase
MPSAHDSARTRSSHRSVRAGWEKSTAPATLGSAATSPSILEREFSERFEREARAIAALNHPHVCQLYDVGQDYLVMELIDGSPLEGLLPLERSVEYATQILDALDAAHQKDITHRDLKPANILVTKQGIKLLDFGLAKQTAVLKETEVTLTRALTQQGQMLGTFQYMSPEQLQGKEVDQRSDLFSFGCVFYEMLNGKSPFRGESGASVIAAILEREPASLTIAPRLEWIVKRSLAKDPDQRFQTARDLKASLRSAMEQPVPGVPAPNRRPFWAVIAAATLVIGVIGGWAMSNFLKKSVGDPIQLAINPPSETIFSGGSSSSVPTPQFAVAPDGRAIVFIASIDAGRSALWVRFMDDVTARQLPGTDNPSSPFWSPD